MRPGESYKNIRPEDLAAWMDELVDVTIAVDDARGDLYAPGRKRAR